MNRPLHTDSALAAHASCERLLQDWIANQGPLGVRGVLIAGPDIRQWESGSRNLWLTVPAVFRQPVAGLARGGRAATVRPDGQSTSVAFVNFSTSELPWTDALRRVGLRSFVRVDVSVGASNGFEVYALLDQSVAEAAACQIACELLNVWPLVRRNLLGASLDLSPAVIETLRLVALEGLTNKEIADRLGVAIRTVGYQLTAAKEQLGVEVKAREPVLVRAALLGLL